MAHAMRDFLVELGVPVDKIIVDPRGGNTAGEMEIFWINFCSGECILRNLDKGPGPEKVLFVTTWYHVPRVWWISLWYRFDCRRSVATAWRHANLRGDLLVEPLKILKAVIGPRRFAKRL